MGTQISKGFEGLLCFIKRSGCAGGMTVLEEGTIGKQLLPLGDFFLDELFFSFFLLTSSVLFFPFSDFFGRTEDCFIPESVVL